MSREAAPRAAFSLCAEHVRQLGGEILLAILMEEKVREAPGPRGGAWAERTVEQTREAMAGDGIFFYLVPRRIPLEFYRAKRHPFPVSPDTLQSAKGETLAYNDSTYPTFEEMVQKAIPAGNRIWLVLSGDREPEGNDNRGSQRLLANYGDAHHWIETQDLPGITVWLFDSGNAAGRKLLGASSTASRRHP